MSDTHDTHPVHHAGHGHGHGDHGHDAHGHDEHPTVPMYVGVFIALMVLLVITLWAAAQNFGVLNLPIALLIAVAKVVLIMSIFMHLKFSTFLVRFFALMAFGWLAILFILTLADYASRSWIPMPWP